MVLKGRRIKKATKRAAVMPNEVPIATRTESCDTWNCQRISGGEEGACDILEHRVGYSASIAQTSLPRSGPARAVYYGEWKP